MTIDEGLSVRGISCDFVYRGSDNLRPRRKGARTLQACGHWTRNRCKRPRRAYVVARRWPTFGLCGSVSTRTAMGEWSRSFMSVTANNRYRRCWLSRARRGSLQGSVTKSAPISCCVQNELHARHGAVSGPTPISPLYGRKILPELPPHRANLHWLRARSCRCGKAAPQYI